MTYDEWVERAGKGTSGDMVWDILRDWKKERELLLDKTITLLELSLRTSND